MSSARAAMTALALALLAPASGANAGGAKQPPARDLVVSDPPAIEVAGGKIEARIFLDAASVGATEASLTRLYIAPGTVIDMHVHPDSTEVIYLLSGEGDLQRSKSKSHLSPGHAALIPAGAVHGFTAGADPVVMLQFFLPGGPEQRLRDA